MFGVGQHVWKFRKLGAKSLRSYLLSSTFQDPKMEILCHIRPYFWGIFPYIGLILRPFRFLKWPLTKRKQKLYMSNSRIVLASVNCLATAWMSHTSPFTGFGDDDVSDHLRGAAGQVKRRYVHQKMDEPWWNMMKVPGRALAQVFFSWSGNGPGGFNMFQPLLQYISLWGSASKWTIDKYVTGKCLVPGCPRTILKMTKPQNCIRPIHGPSLENTKKNHQPHNFDVCKPVVFKCI
jgi:hypothetical protein